MPFNQTKIVCTIGPATESKKMMRKLVENGMNTMRLNFSHSNYEEHEARLNTLIELNAELDTNVASLLDTKGPEIRTHGFKGGKARITIGSRVDVYMDEIEGDETKFSVSYPDLYKDVEIGGTIVVDDGYLSLKVDAIDEENRIIRTTSFNTHTIRDKRGINVPGMMLNLDFVSEKDYQDIVWACEQGIDFIAASFVRRREDVEKIREIIKEHTDKYIQIIAKIENQEGVNNIDDIIAVSDGVMIARGDLGVEVPPEEVPVIQKDIIARCHAAGKISITATQMLESMQEHPKPTRAEVSDVANAILDGTDAIMLSGESAIGNYPVESVKMMCDIALRMEKELRRDLMISRANRKNTKDIPSNIAMSAAHAVLQGQADLVIAPTVSGMTARLLSKNRPNTMILALVPSNEKARSLALHHGVNAIEFHLGYDTESLVKRSIEYVKKENMLEPGGRVIITGGFPLGTTTNSLRIMDIK
ncbi:MAG: pyruvate kinase [Bacillota bacterium]